MDNKILGINATSYLFIAIIIIASFLRLYNLIPVNNIGLPPGLYPDEAMNGNNAVEAIESGDYKIFYPENFGREGLFINIQSLSIGVFGNTPWALRLPSAIFGILTVLGLYFMTKELGGSKKLALLTALLLATSFWHIDFSRIGFRAIMAPFFMVWAVYFLTRSFRAGYYVLPALIGGLVYGLGFHSYIAYRATPLLILLIMGLVYWNNRGAIDIKIKSIFIIFILGTIIAALPLGIYFLKNPLNFMGRTTGISVLNSTTPFKDLGMNILKTAGMFNFVGDFNWRHNIAGRPLLFWPVGIAFLMGIIISIKKFKKEFASPELILFGWLLVAALPVVISNEGMPHALRSIIMVPPVFIFAGIGMLAFYDFLKSKMNNRLLMIFSCVFLSLLVFEAYFSYFIRWGENPNVKNAFDYNDYIISWELNNLPLETPKYVVVPGAGDVIQRDNPISLQSVLFLTDTFSAQKRAEKNFFYLNERQFESIKIPDNAKIIKLP